MTDEEIKQIEAESRHWTCPLHLGLHIRRLLYDVKARTWQPIETAPKDGTKVLAFDGLGKTRPFALVMKFNVDVWEDTLEGMSWEPSHWMPLPPPPAAAQTTEGKE